MWTAHSFVSFLWLHLMAVRFRALPDCLGRSPHWATPTIIHHRHLLNDRQHYRAGVRTAEPDTLRRLFIVILLSVHNILDVRLRVAVVQREERRLHLDHDSMARPKYVVHVGQFPCVALHFAWLEWRGLRKAFQVAAAEDLNTDR